MGNKITPSSSSKNSVVTNKMDCDEFKLSPITETKPQQLFKLDLVEGTIVKRPSAKCKTPYVADVVLKETNESILGHTPALGCCGLSDKEATVLLSKIPKKSGSKEQVCSHRVELGTVIQPLTGEQIYIGLNPKLAEEIVEKCLQINAFDEGVLQAPRFKREQTILNSRFDFVGYDSKETPFVLEVKTVPLTTQHKHERFSYFPDGYRKKKGDPVSPRALKHLNDLIEIAQKSETRAIMCYVLQRSDTEGFIPSDSDPIYKAKLCEAYRKGVEIFIVNVSYSRDGICSLINYDLFKA